MRAAARTSAAVPSPGRGPLGPRPEVVFPPRRKHLGNSTIAPSPGTGRERNTLRLAEDEAARLIEYVRRTSGILLGPESISLLESRLAPLMASAGLRTGQELLRALERSDRANLHEELMDRITTHETSFFRDQGPFRALQQHVLPELVRRPGEDRLARVWCAACSTGQEPYSLAILLAETAPALKGLRVEILATDLSRRAVARARTGLYTQLEINRGLSQGRLARHFRPEGRHWRAAPELRAAVSFRQHNLATDPPPCGSFDVILCRNVLIYLALDVRVRVFDSLHRALAPEGYLFLGAAESPSGTDLRFHHFGSRDHFGYRPAPARPARRAA